MNVAAIRLDDIGLDLADGAHPEFGTFTDAEMSAYSEILAQGGNISDIVQEATKIDEPKPLDDANAMAVFIDEVTKTAGGSDLPEPDEKPKKKSAMKPIVFDLSSSKLAMKESKQVKDNTRKWANVKLEMRPAP